MHMWLCNRPTIFWFHPTRFFLSAYQCMHAWFILTVVRQHPSRMENRDRWVVLSALSFYAHLNPLSLYYSCITNTKIIFKITQSNPTSWTPHYYRQFALSLGKESPYIFPKFNPLNMDTLLIQTLSLATSSQVRIHSSTCTCIKIRQY